LVQAADGNFYGTTYLGGTSTHCDTQGDGCGTVFKITPSGTLTTLFSFDNINSSALPTGGLIQGTDGNFYGTTNDYDQGGYGTVFQITPGGTLTTLHRFEATDGEYPDAGLVQGTDGNFYGTTFLGGAYEYGTIFRLSVGLGPFVKTLPTSGKVGTTVYILGNNLTGATGVTFNGTGAQFTVASSTEIKTAVPSGATTGKVKVTTPHGTLTSNVSFRVP
jgi:uncharacterized repeat protein (TIGR03803 family)